MRTLYILRLLYCMRMTVIIEHIFTCSFMFFRTAVWYKVKFAVENILNPYLHLQLPYILCDVCIKCAFSFPTNV